MCSDVAVCVRSLYKHYRVYKRSSDRVWQFLLGNRKQLYRKFQALENITFDVRRGETFGILGRNGAGKSTLLELICGTAAPNSGSVEVNGRVAALLELGAGFNPEFTGRENVYMNAEIMGLTPKEIDSRFDSIVEFSGVRDFIDEPVKTYSSGMYMRLAFAVMVHLDADILVIDEALAVGDAFFTQKCMRFLNEFRKRGTLLFVSHDTASVVALCDRAIWLDQGRVRDIGKAKDVCEAYLAAFFEDQQGAKEVDNHTTLDIRLESDKNELMPRDQRLEFINLSPLRNDIEMFAFNLDGGAFGKGGAKITHVQLADKQNMPLSWVVGGEIVTLSVRVRALVDISKPIIGFYVKNKLGQNLFGDNTYLTYIANPISVGKGQIFKALFSFRMPILPVGDYSIAVAVAEGTQDEHVQHHWIHDAIVFKSHASSVSMGLVGIPMLDISLNKFYGYPRDSR